MLVIIMSRGALIVFEGCDRVGKSTQCKKLVEALTNAGVKNKVMRFPGEGTAVTVKSCTYLIHIKS